MKNLWDYSRGIPARRLQAGWIFILGSLKWSAGWRVSRSCYLLGFAVRSRAARYYGFEFYISRDVLEKITLWKQSLCRWIISVSDNSTAIYSNTEEGRCSCMLPVINLKCYIAKWCLYNTGFEEILQLRNSFRFFIPFFLNECVTVVPNNSLVFQILIWVIWLTKSYISFILGRSVFSYGWVLTG